MSSRILLVEDDEGISAGLVRALEGHGYQVLVAGTGAQALEEATTQLPDLVLLDLGLPDVDGLEVCRKLRTDRPDLPVLILTARVEEIDVVVGLDAGAVDYVSKPFRLAELMARVRAHLRHPEKSGVLEVGALTVDQNSRRVWRAGLECDLTAKEFDLLSLLAANAGRVLTREELICEVWDENWFGSTKTLDVHVASLRRKIGEGPGGPSCISTLRGVGYRLEAAVQ